MKNWFKPLLKKKATLGILSGVTAVLVVIGFQNCGPVNFRNLSSQNNAKGNDINIIPPSPSCDGFWVNKISQVNMPSGQTTVNVSLNGELGDAFGPMNWIVTSSLGAPITAVGINVSVPLSIGTYNVIATSGDNYCRESFQLVVQPSTCVSPLATALDFEVVTPVDQRIENMPIQFKVNNFANVQNLRVQWQLAGAFENQSTALFSHTYSAAGTYQVTAKANDKVCPENELSSSLPVTIKLRDCKPATNSINIAPLTPNPSANTTVSFNVNNLSDLQGGSVEVEWQPGLKQTYTSNPISHVFSDVVTSTSRNIIFRAKAKETEARCQMPLEYAYNHTQLPACVRQINNINVTSNPSGPDIFTSTPVTFATTHANDDFTSFTWSLGNGQTGTSIASLKAAGQQFYPQPSNAKATFYAMGPKTCNETLYLEIPFNVTQQTFQYDFQILQSSVTPPVKMFFILDNSETMANEQTFLPAAYNQMFASGGSNLRGFEVESSIFTTAQYVDPTAAHLWSPSLGDYVYNIPSSTVATQTANKSYNSIYNSAVHSGSPSYLTGWRYFAPPSITTRDYGSLAGDVIGIVRNTTQQNTVYSLAPVYGIAPGANGAAAAPVVLKSKLAIGPNAQQSDVDQMQNDFAERIKLLNPLAYSNANHYYDFFRITMQENQHCAIARILKNSDQYLTRGSKPTFVVVTDENESGVERRCDSSGANCSDVNYNYMDGKGCVESAGQTTYYQGYCGTYGTKFTFETGAYCNIHYAQNSKADYKTKKTNYSYTLRICDINDTGTCNYHNEVVSGDRAGWPSGVTAVGAVSTSACENMFSLNAQNNYVSGSAVCTAVTENHSYVLVQGYQPIGSVNDSWCSSVINYVSGSCRIYDYFYRDNRIDPVNGTCPSSLCDGKFSCTAQLRVDQGVEYDETPNLTCSSCMTGSGSNCITWQDYFISQYNAPVGGSCSTMPYTLAAGAATEVTNEQNACPAGQHWVRTGTQARSGVSYVSGTQSNGQPVPLRTYIKTRINELTSSGVLPPTIVSFVKTANTSGDPGSKIDTQMKQTMIEVMGGTTLPVPGGGNVNMYNSVYDTANYAMAFQQFAAFISKSLIRVYNLQITVPAGKVLVISSVSKNGVTLVPDVDYTVDIPNKRIVFKDSLPVSPNDFIHVVYYFN